MFLSHESVINYSLLCILECYVRRHSTDSKTKVEDDLLLACGMVGQAILGNLQPQTIGLTESIQTC